jgi:hypothetical protein
MLYDYVGYFQRLLVGGNLAVTVTFRRVEPCDGDTKLNDCHNTVDR